MKYINILLAISALAFSSCQKDKSKTCTYYNKPLPIDVKFVNYFDYEVSNFDVYQYQKGSDFQTLIKKDEVRNNQLVQVINDTSSSLFLLSNKADYLIVLTQLDDTFRIENINYQPEYFDVVEKSGKCDQQLEYSQIADSALVNQQNNVLHKITAEQANLYLAKP